MPAPSKLRWTRLVAIAGVCGLLAALVLPGSPQALGENLISNPSVETVAGSSPAGWSTNSYGSLQPTFTVISPGQSGNNALRVSVSRFRSGEAKWQFASVPAVPNARYDISVQYKASTWVEAVGDITLANGQHQYVSLGWPGPTNNWKRFAASFTAPSSARQVAFYVKLPGNGWLQTDSYSLAQMTAGTPATTTTTPTTTTRPPTITAAPTTLSPSTSTTTTSTTSTTTTSTSTTTTVAPTTTTSTTTTTVAPAGQKCVIGAPGAGGNPDVSTGFSWGYGYDWDPARYITKGLPDGAELSHLQTAAAGCDVIIVHGFSEGGRRAKEWYCSSHTLGGRIIGYIIDDPNYFPDEGQPCTPGTGVKVALYGTKLGPGDNRFTVDYFLEGLGYGAVMDKTAARLHTPIKLSPRYFHEPYTRPSPPEIANPVSAGGWW